MSERGGYRGGRGGRGGRGDGGRGGRGDGGRGRGDGGRGRYDGGRGRGDGGGRGGRGGRGGGGGRPAQLIDPVQAAAQVAKYMRDGRFTAPPSMGTLSISSGEAAGVSVMKRPAFGQLGRPIDLKTNLFACSLNGMTVDQYAVHIVQLRRNIQGEEEEASTPPLDLSIKAIRQCAVQGRWPREAFAYDGRSTLYASDRAGFPQTGSIQYDVEVDDGGRPGRIRVRLDHATTVRMADVQNYINGNATVEQAREACRVIEVCLKFVDMQSPNVIVARRGVYNIDGESFDLGGGIQGLVGFSTSVRPTGRGLGMIIDLAHTGFYSPVNLVDFVRELFQSRGGGGRGGGRGGRGGGRGGRGGGVDVRQVLEHGLDAGQVRDLNKLLKKLKLLQDMSNNKVRTRSVKEVSRGNAQTTMFEMERDGQTRQISVDQYYADKNIRLQYPKLNLINVGNRARPVYVPMELLRIKQGQMANVLSPEQTAQMVRQAAIEPGIRFSRIQACCNHLQGREHVPLLGSLGKGISSQAVTAKGRVLPPPALQYNDATVLCEDGVWNMANRRMIQGAKIDSWAAVSFVPERNFQNLSFEQFLLSDMVGMARNMGMEFARGEVQVAYAQQREQARDVISRAKSFALRDFGCPPKIIFVLLRNTDAALYRAVKQAGDCLEDAVTQCMVYEKAKFFTGSVSPQYTANVLLKVNLKCRGVNLKIPGSPAQMYPVLGEKPFMIVGISLSHPMGFNTQVPTVGAVVGSMDTFGAQFVSRPIVLEHRQTVVNVLSEQIVALVQEFRKRNNNKAPARFLVYRDGVADSQFEDALDKEYGAIVKALESCQLQSPEVAYVVVQKRHSQRFMPDNPRAADRKGNCKPGVVVDCERVTNSHMYEFYLNSQAGLQGTNVPSRYTVLMDQIGLGPDCIQLLTYWQSFLFARCTRSVKVPAAVYYADCAAYRARLHLIGDEDAMMSDTVSNVSDAPMMQQYPLGIDVSTRMYYA